MIQASPGSRHFQMNKSKSGHWQIPISRFRRKQDGKTSNMVVATEKTDKDGAATGASSFSATTPMTSTPTKSVSWVSSPH